ncbi:GNAT family N-acetyltransferase [Streptomyces sp. ISL-100]|uniref:GNAT family N-acetyltransferase n=1 Tax=Streptomyces sp. ISL-100 TaxID=2819173 RepID=UPI001BE894A2|nr:GNAT family N-acetyltransferase [Streptomyces sp. ISL-100]MBT2401562.1 GNAT family N-acetyltransferase [Streptomyces sp. ISL-100]
MDTSVRRAVAEDLPKVYALLRDSSLNSAWVPLDARRRMFRPVWGGDEGYYGYVLEDGDDVVGFLGLLFTEREISGVKRKFCEIHSWYVKEEYRHDSMKLFLPALSVRKATLVNYTPTQTVYDISKKFGFDDLETKLRAFLPVPTFRSLGLGVRLETKKHVIVQYLDEADRKIFLDHTDVECNHFLIRGRSDTDYSYIILKKMRLGRFRPFGRVLYASNKKMLVENIDFLKLYWCFRFGVALIAMDDDELGTDWKLPFTKVIPREFPSLYKSKELEAADIKPALYTLPLLIGYRLH